jgi:hypothetical protein
MKKIATLSFAVLGIVFLAGCGQQQKPQQSQQLETQTSAGKSDALNAMTQFKKTFFESDYELQQSAVGRDTMTTYFKHGAFVRQGDELSKIYFIYKSGKVFSVKPTDKTFKEFDGTKAPWDKLSSDSFTLILPLMRDTIDGKVLWDKESENTYITTGPWNMTNDDGSTSPIMVKISINPQTKLIDALYMQAANSGEPWVKMDYKYRAVNNIEDLMSFPFDYKKSN